RPSTPSEHAVRARRPSTPSEHAMFRPFLRYVNRTQHAHLDVRPFRSHVGDQARSVANYALRLRRIRCFRLLGG
ncbi:MAG TPA: hypothetical protein VK636_09700, partial [Gemmatimonadaceae bacterium]|nr:hypothetical protein [Gemmatimonadaceae bacterium]